MSSVIKLENFDSISILCNMNLKKKTVIVIIISSLGEDAGTA